MIWVIVFTIVWVAVSGLVTYPYINQIENLPKVEDKVFSYILFAAGGPLFFIVGFITDTLEEIGINFEDDDEGPWDEY